MTRSRLARYLVFILCTIITIPGPATAETPANPQRSELIRLALTNPQMVLRRDQNDNFQMELCRCPVPVQTVPKFLKWALISTEDRHFNSIWRHFGFDPLAVGRAALSGGSQGGSGLNQQIAKNLLDGNNRSYFRKLRELLDAVTIESMFSKDEILVLYFNNMDFGFNDGREVFGIEQAARAYFGKTTDALNLYESAVLVGMLKGPSIFSPTRNPEASSARADHVLDRMVAEGYIDNAQRLAARKTGPKPGKLQPVPLETVYYTSWIRHELTAYAPHLAGQSTIRVVFGMDPVLQLDAQRQIAELLRQGATLDTTQAALVSINADGLVRAIVGGADFSKSQLDRATMVRRQPGSSFKPFVYLTALEAGMKPNDRILDAAVTNGWPRNFSKTYEGMVTLRYALAQSLNGATARLGQSVGPPAIANTAQRLGIKSPLTPNPSLALGSSEVSLLELTGAYSTIANHGRQIQPHGVIAIVSIDGSILDIPPIEPGRQVINPATAEAMTGMLRNVVTSGTGIRANFGATAVGKTGTTQDNRDAWFIGFDRSTHLVTGIWAGNDDDSPMRDVTGATLPAEAFRRFYTDRAPHPVPPKPTDPLRLGPA